MAAKEIGLVLSADAWDMEDEKTKARVKGVSVWFLTEYRETSDEVGGPVGFKPSKTAGTPELLEKLRGMSLPAQCEMHYGSKPGAAGKATLILNDVTFVKSVDVFGTAAANASAVKKTA